jgi:riboflavin synthase alpha subunit
MAHTNLGRAQADHRVNLECDLIGKYVVRVAEIAGLTLAPLETGEVRH